MLGVQNKLFVSIITTFPCIKQNPTLIDCLLAIDLVSCNIDKVKVNITSPSKDYSHFGTTPSAREEWPGEVFCLFLIKVNIMIISYYAFEHISQYITLETRKYFLRKNIVVVLFFRTCLYTFPYSNYKISII